MMNNSSNMGISLVLINSEMFQVNYHIDVGFWLMFFVVISNLLKEFWGEEVHGSLVIRIWVFIAGDWVQSLVKKLSFTSFVVRLKKKFFNEHLWSFIKWLQSISQDNHNLTCSRK